MGLPALTQTLLEQIEQIPVIDAHEHLPPEEVRTSQPVDVFTLFSHYTQGDLQTAGMPDVGFITRPEVPLEERWKSFEPYWRQIRYGGYARAALLAARRFYGFDDINEATYRPLSEAIAAANTPGIYRRVLREVCGIETALTQQAPRWDPDGVEPPLFVPVSWLTIATTKRAETLQPTELGGETIIATLDGYIAVLRAFMEKKKAEGTVGVKIFAHPFGEPNRHKAAGALWQYRCGEIETLPEVNPLHDYLTDAAIGLAGELDLTVAIHTGYWGDFRQLDPLHMIPLLMRHPRTRFDIYHLGYPWVRETLMLGKTFPNVWLNLCWTHIISSRMAVAALDEAIDLLPMNKLVAFGGDYSLPVEKVYGHLTMARENIATVLARRVEAGDFGVEEALRLARQWLYENPKTLYRMA